MRGNFTLPACSTYNGKAYVSCNHCNVSSYTAMNVTYGCYDINNLCPSYVTPSSSTAGTSTKRQLLEGDTSSSSPSRDVFVEFDEDVGDDNDAGLLSVLPRFANAVTEEFEDSMREFEEEATRGETDEQEEWGLELELGFNQSDHDRHRHGNHHFNHHRFLQQVTTDDGNATDDGGSTDDGVLSSKAQSSISEYGALLNALADELVSTLSINPFNIDLSQATPILALCGSLAGCILFGALFLTKWDAGDPPRPLDPSSLVYTLRSLPPVVYISIWSPLFTTPSIPPFPLPPPSLLPLCIPAIRFSPPYPSLTPTSHHSHPLLFSPLSPLTCLQWSVPTR